MSRAPRVVVAGLLTAATVALGASALEAQRGPRRGGPGTQDRQELMQRIRERFAQMVREELGLGEEEARALGEVVRSFDDQRRALAREERALRRRVEAVLLETGPDDDEARELLARMSELRVREASLFAEEQEGLLEVLAPEQVLRFMALRERMAQRIRALRRGGPPGRGPGGAGGAAMIGTDLPADRAWSGLLLGELLAGDRSSAAAEAVSGSPPER